MPGNDNTPSNKKTDRATEELNSTTSDEMELASLVEGASNDVTQTPSTPTTTDHDTISTDDTNTSPGTIAASPTSTDTLVSANHDEPGEGPHVDTSTTGLNGEGEGVEGANVTGSANSRKEGEPSTARETSPDTGSTDTDTSPGTIAALPDTNTIQPANIPREHWEEGFPERDMDTSTILQSPSPDANRLADSRREGEPISRLPVEGSPNPNQPPNASIDANRLNPRGEGEPEPIENQVEGGPHSNNALISKLQAPPSPPSPVVASNLSSNASNNGVGGSGVSNNKTPQSPSLTNPLHNSSSNSGLPSSSPQVIPPPPGSQHAPQKPLQQSPPVGPAPNLGPVPKITGNFPSPAPVSDAELAAMSQRIKENKENHEKLFKEVLDYCSKNPKSNEGILKEILDDIKSKHDEWLVNQKRLEESRPTKQNFAQLSELIQKQEALDKQIKGRLGHFMKANQNSPDPIPSSSITLSPSSPTPAPGKGKPLVHSPASSPPPLGANNSIGETLRNLAATSGDMPRVGPPAQHVGHQFNASTSNKIHEAFLNNFNSTEKYQQKDTNEGIRVSRKHTLLNTPMFDFNKQSGQIRLSSKIKDDDLSDVAKALDKTRMEKGASITLHIRNANDIKRYAQLHVELSEAAGSPPNPKPCHVKFSPEKLEKDFNKAVEELAKKRQKKLGSGISIDPPPTTPRSRI